MVHGNEIKGVAVRDSFRKIRLMSVPQTPHVNVLIFTQSEEGNVGSGTSTSLIVARGPS
jgi:hypothetical protein